MPWAAAALFKLTGRRRRRRLAGAWRQGNAGLKEQRRNRGWRIGAHQPVLAVKLDTGALQPVERRNQGRAASEFAA
jgi:hypothetical protein